MKKIISTLLIVLGVLIALYPFASNMYSNYWNNKLLAQVELEINFEPSVPMLVESDFLALEAMFQEGVNEEDLELIEDEDDFIEVLEDQDADSDNEEEEIEREEPAQPTNNSPVLGQLVIPKIDVKMAILEGASERNLNRGVARIEGTSAINEIGNIGIAGHRGRSYGRLLNRLDELVIDDIIEITSGGVKYTYRVYKTHLVEPSDVSVLYRSTSHKVLTLVTCDPVINPTHRLIVHAVQIEP